MGAAQRRGSTPHSAAPGLNLNFPNMFSRSFESSALSKVLQSKSVRQITEPKKPASQSY